MRLRLRRLPRSALLLLALLLLLLAQHLLLRL